MDVSVAVIKVAGIERNGKIRKQKRVKNCSNTELFNANKVRPSS